MNELDRLKDRFLKEIDTFDGNSFYASLHVFADAANKWRRDGGKKGWSSTIRAPTGEAVFKDEAEQAIVEEFFDVLYGGEAAAAAVMVGGNTVEKIKELATRYVDPESISMDLAYKRTTEFMDMMDSKTKDLARQVGIIKFQDTIPPIPLYQFGIPYEIAPRTLIPIVNGIIELVRIFATFGPERADFLRVPLSVLTAMIDIGRGDWKKALLSMMGTLGRWPASIGIFGKLLRDVFLFVSPDLTTEMRDLFYKSTKSFFAGVLFWAFSTFAPEPVYRGIESIFKEMSGIIESINKKIDDAEGMVASQLPDTMKKCYDIQFRRIPEGILPEFDNLEALQAAFQAPELYCNDMIRSKIVAMRGIPPIRLMLEFLNIPTLDEDFEERCRGVETGAPEDAILAALTPIVRKKPGCILDE